MLERHPERKDQLLQGAAQAKVMKENISILISRETLPYLYLLICDMIKQNEAEVYYNLLLVSEGFFLNINLSN